jgi:hypothetical protein
MKKGQAASLALFVLAGESSARGLRFKQQETRERDSDEDRFA